MPDNNQKDIDELVPNYPYPTALAGGLGDAENVMRHWRSNIDLLLSLSPQEQATHIAALQDYATWFINHANKRGRLTYWNVLDDERMPNDARTDFIKQPTCIALATLNILRGYLRDNEALQSSIEKVFCSTSLFILKQGGLAGNGYDRYDYMSVFLSVLQKGGVIQTWVDRESDFAELVATLRSIGSNFANDPEHFSSTEAGYYSITEEKVATIIAALTPAMQNIEVTHD